ncbi:MAG: putative nucleic acid-binding protein [Paracoccaceae bacterium]|jgi:predicted nucleic acid-binding protein
MIFVDSSFWIAFRNEKDVNHERAIQMMQEFFRLREQLVITDHIFAETHAYFVRSAVKRKQIMGDLLDNPVVRNMSIGTEDRNLALKWLRERNDKVWSYVDALSFAIIERNGIQAAASFDAHFGQPGTFRHLG